MEGDSQFEGNCMVRSEAELSRERLLAGVRKFRREVYPHRQADYERVVREGQKPHALFITCADSRVDPELLTQSGPGEIFVLRNIGNLVPAYGEMLGGVSSAVEFAVAALQVKQIVVCGHADCGAMKGLLHPEQLSTMPTVKSWLRNAEAALSVVQARNPVEPATLLLDNLIEENVLLQISHLRTHPSVAARIAAGKMILSGWVYDIARGTVHLYDEGQSRFVPVEAESEPTLG